jgi:protein TonB
LGLEGDVSIRVSLTTHGNATALTLHRSSGHDLLDEEALRMVRAASPFPALPPTFTKSEAVIVIPIHFRLRS